MARPKPTTILQHTEGYNLCEVLAADTTAHLAYRGEPVSYRVTNRLTGKYHYPKTASTNPQFIELLAAKLNSIHNTTDFGVVSKGKI